MLFFFFIFTLIGFIIYKFIDKNGPFIIIIISIVWGLSSGTIWGLASLGEMFLGFYVAQSLFENK
jgi:hypothetical protein